MGRSHKTIGLISSVAFESALIKRTASSAHTLSPGIWAGKLKGRSVVHVTSGVGIANAAWAATVLMERFGAGLCLNLGIAGAYPSSGLVPGDVAVASEEVYADTGLALAGGCKGMQEMGIPLLTRGSTRRYNAFPMDTPLARRAARAAVEAGYPVVIGRFLTVAQATGTLKRAKELERKHKAVVENMEGAAVGMYAHAMVLRPFR